MEELYFCHFHGYKVKDADARQQLQQHEEKISNLQTQQDQLGDQIAEQQGAAISNLQTQQNQQGAAISNLQTQQNQQGAAIAGLLGMFTEDTTHPGCLYRNIAGEKEWHNPPMELDTEYRTTERYKGLPVYTKLFDIGLLPSNNTQKWVSYPLDVLHFLRVEGKGEFSCFPRVGSYGATCGTDSSLAGIGVYVSQDGNAPGNIAIGIYTDGTATNLNATVQLWYTKG